MLIWLFRTSADNTKIVSKYYIKTYFYVFISKILIFIRCLNNVWALKQAQRTVEKYYATLGVLDELNATLEVLEHELPYFFKGASKLYYRDLLRELIFLHS